MPLFAFTVFQIINPVLPPEVGAADGAATIGRIVSAIIGVMLIAGFVLALFHIIFGAIAWISAGGDKNRLQAAQERITAAVVGLIIAAAIWSIMLLIGTFLGFGFPKFDIPTFLDPGAPAADPDAGAPGYKFPPIPI
jgi:hypothetical protein